MSDASLKSAKPSRRGSPALLIILVVILAPAFAIGELAGAGGASIIGGFVALFSLLATMGSSLRADLRRLALIGPLIAFGAVAPRLLAEVSIPASFALTTVLIFVAGLFPLRGRVFDGVALGLGMGTLLGYSLPISGAANAWQLILAGVIGVAVALGLRALIGVRDPSGPTRKAVADLFTEPTPDIRSAFDAWASDRPVRWLGNALVSAGQYRLARRVLEAHSAGAAEGFLTTSSDRASAIATSVRAKPDVPYETVEHPARELSPATLGDVTAAVSGALDQAERALADRDLDLVPIPTAFRSKLTLLTVRDGLRHGSVQVRHALRTAVAVLVALVVSSFLDPGDPLLPTLLVTTFALVQVSWRATLSRAGARLLGVAAGGILVVLVVLFLPSSFLLPVSLVGLGVGLWFVTARPAVGTAGILVMSVGLNAGLRHLDPREVIVEYVILTAIAVAIGALLGFAVIPGWRPQKLVVRVAVATEAVKGALEVIAVPRSDENAARTLDAIAVAQSTTQQLSPDRENLTHEQSTDLERLRTSLQDLLFSALYLSTEPSSVSDKEPLRLAAEILSGQPALDPQPLAKDGTVANALVLLAREASAATVRLLAASPH